MILLGRCSVLALCVLLVACSGEVAMPSEPGAYLQKLSDTKARLVVVTPENRVLSATGTFNSESPVPPALARITPSSVNGRYLVTTPNCGRLHFTEGKGVGVFCEECELVNMNRSGFASCELLQSNLPVFWTPQGI